MSGRVGLVNRPELMRRTLPVSSVAEALSQQEFEFTRLDARIHEKSLREGRLLYATSEQYRVL